jgi:hypothetical protein
LRCLDALGDAGIAEPAWSFGGGTMLMLRHAHRRSRDIDLFLHDAQIVAALSPRLNATAAGIAASYEESASSVKLSLAEGDIDFIVAPSLLGLPTIPMPFEGRLVATDASAEIIAKKLFYRTASFKVRDVFDLAVVLALEPEAATPLRDLLSAKREQLRRRLRTLESSFAARVSTELDVLPDGRSHLDGALARAREFVES